MNWKVILGTVVTLTLVILACYWATQALFRRRQLDTVRTTQMARLTLPLDKTGTYETTIQQDFPSSCKQVLSLEFPSPINSFDQTEEALAKFSATATITAPDGTSTSFPLSSQELFTWYGDDSGQPKHGFMIRLPEKGRYKLTVQVTKPAGSNCQKVTLVGRHVLCGLEEMPALFLTVLALGSGVLALVSGIITVFALYRARRVANREPS